MHTVELLLDDGLERGVRDLWRRLDDAGLPSLARHRHPSNRPHLTVVTAGSRAGLTPPRLPVAAELGAVRLLGRTLIRPVTPTAELTALHARVWAELAGADTWPSPADWVPHVSLALRVPGHQREAALALLSGEPPVRGSFVATRSYDTVTREVCP